jgi:soluble lytic murein transglycosylase-like protein
MLHLPFSLLLAVTTKASVATIEANIQAFTASEQEAALVRAIIQTESSFKPMATGKLGEVGLMQLRPEMHQVTYNITDNIKAGVKYLRILRQQCLDLGDAWFVCYNTGPGRKPKDGTKLKYYRRVKLAYEERQDYTD